ncbi:3-methylornithyl-N6-L-lysine dehydrogenase PylD [Methanolobus chelungpuianus]|uniref:6-phosphogluconate dehydrogenase n=1 Tax=Methanolobus chelungpuianus TaxID=502115 RepID=A0AAE3HD99_9EURY|nr:3-methylornithyl-N6-L-lysine dehydrogenase PylD [Methanolobus chelungpuianus]MCQ6963819.1 6-phosphogluconate dehydrogenase [Methanolobus chelungpuianus]
MALLTPQDLENLSVQLEENDATIKKVTGLDVRGICGELYGTKPDSQKIGIIPISSGEGIIGNFASSLLFIAQYFGLNGFITEHPDITGYYEAVSQGADIILMADDHMFVAHNLRNGRIASNHVATGVIYAEIASRFREATSKDILVIGLGRVGYAGAAHLVRKGFNVYACDPNRAFLEKAVQELGISPYCREDRKRFSMVFEATPNPDTISEGMIEERCLVSTPGIPCGLPPEIGRKYRVDLVMEPLVIGVASMLYSVM